MLRIKICGITRPADARLAVQAGADAIGLNFYAPSPRSLTLEQAQEICQQLEDNVQRVGVFVNHSEDAIRLHVEELQLDLVQLHGDEPAELIQALQPLDVIKACRCRNPGLDDARQLLAECREREALPAAMLLDAHVPGEYGGTGQVLEWQQFGHLDGALDGCPLILSGGLTADNVATAIEQARPRAVDTASGVESEPGLKDADLLARFIDEAQAAFSELSS